MHMMHLTMEKMSSLLKITSTQNILTNQTS
jgi:hypothetical protein